MNEAFEQNKKLFSEEGKLYEMTDNEKERAMRRIEAAYSGSKVEEIGLEDVPDCVSEKIKFQLFRDLEPMYQWATREGEYINKEVLLGKKPFAVFKVRLPDGSASYGVRHTIAQFGFLEDVPDDSHDIELSPRECLEEVRFYDVDSDEKYTGFGAVKYDHINMQPQVNMIETDRGHLRQGLASERYFFMNALSKAFLRNHCTLLCL